MAGDNELSSIGGFMRYRDEAVPGQIKSLIENQENKEFELGLKYPLYNWKPIVKKYGIASKPQIIEKEFKYGDGDSDIYIYEIFSGKDVVIGHSIGRKRLKKGKLEETIMDDNAIGTLSDKPTEYQKQRDITPGFNGGYWGVASSKIEVVEDIAKMLTSQKDGYVKDLDIYVNGLGGVAPDALKANNVKFEGGGTIPNNYEGKSTKNIWNAWDKKQKTHFLEDHTYSTYDNDNGGENKYIPTKEIEKLVEMEYEELPSHIKFLIFQHTDVGQYEQGGEIGCGCKHALRAAKGTKIAGDIYSNEELQDIKYSIEKAFNKKFENIYKKQMFFSNVIGVGTKPQKEKMYNALLDVEAKNTGALLKSVSIKAAKGTKIAQPLYKIVDRNNPSKEYPLMSSKEVISYANKYGGEKNNFKGDLAGAIEHLYSFEVDVTPIETKAAKGKKYKTEETIDLPKEFLPAGKVELKYNKNDQDGPITIYGADGNIIYQNEATTLNELADSDDDNLSSIAQWVIDNPFVKAAKGTKISVTSTEELKGKFVNIYTLGVKEPTAHKIESAKITPETFEHRNITLTFVGGGQESFPIREYANFLSGKEVIIKDNSGESYVLELIIDKAKKGAKISYKKSSKKKK
jgi:hypothetical protein